MYVCVWFRYLDTQKLDRDLLRCAQHVVCVHGPGLTSVEFRAAAAQPSISHLHLGARNMHTFKEREVEHFFKQNAHILSHRLQPSVGRTGKLNSMD